MSAFQVIYPLPVLAFAGLLSFFMQDASPLTSLLRSQRNYAAARASLASTLLKLQGQVEQAQQEMVSAEAAAREYCAKSGQDLDSDAAACIPKKESKDGVPSGGK